MNQYETLIDISMQIGINVFNCIIKGVAFSQISPDYGKQFSIKIKVTWQKN